ncbi:4-hydroxy-tetrahydrodipicolinate synthase [Anaerovoracaceae bacterium 41-7]|jgi:4-hydroxy-tetrahydrodipicolinate synthase|uniref:4-hydroxy-tetrahydrodipicolinate synthase n=1 Tax=Senimuribacter intestinalis TaxID=2941507 RepID=UPI00203AB088|nr:4-hydroxy-tetrahydrodipicolinate synthase [Senimuribacter intestinalis]MCI9475428.1 4-hydroxy-tetrahydrodipicolinate synthase [Emergencia sp.]
MSIFKGSGVALVTPFKDGRIDYDALERLIEWHIEEGTDAIISCGTTGEASTLSAVEKLSVIEFTVQKVCGRIPVIAGAGTNDTSHSMYLAKEIQYAGADGLLVVTPYYNKATQKGLISHYNMIADYTDLPIILYSVKSRTGLNIEPETVKELSKHPNIVGIKEASGDISQICRIAALCGKNFDLYSGNDDQTIPIMSIGGVGCISTVANIIPKDYHQMTEDFLKGRYKSAAKLQLKMVPLIRALFAEVNPIPVKAALHMMGKIEKEYRLPMCEPSNQTLYQLYDEMAKYGLKVK